MGQAGDLDDVALEQAAGVGVGDHNRGDVIPQLFSEVGEVDAAVGGLGDFLDGVADEGGGGGVGAVGAGGDQDGAAVALAGGLVGGLDAEQAAELAVGAGLGRHGHRRHAGQRLQPMGQAVDQLERALGGRAVSARGAGRRSQPCGRPSLRRGLCFMVHEPSG